MVKTFLILLMMFAYVVHGHDGEHDKTTDNAEVTYLGNTGIMVDHGELQIMFDPFFHNHFNHYQLVPENIRSAIFNDQAPYDSIEMILISHAHSDHFDAKDLLNYLQQHPKTQLLAPSQAVEEIKVQQGYGQVKSQVTGIDLVYGDHPISFEIGDIKVDVVRIPHAGWPGRAHVSNLVYRVTLNDLFTVMHMGDADPDDVHFKPWHDYWQQQVTDNAFPPYWFMLSENGQQILSNRINAKDATGVHVPVKIPAQLQQSGADFFSVPGTIVELSVASKPSDPGK